MTPGGDQKWAKIGPRRPQDSLKELLFRCQNLMSILLSFGLRFGRSWGAFWEPSWRQNRTQNRPKSRTKIDAKKTPLQDRLGAVLERSWIILEAILGAQNRLKPFVLKVRVKIHFFQKIVFQEPSWAQLGPSWVDFASPKAPRWVPKPTEND